MIFLLRWQADASSASSAHSFCRKCQHLKVIFETMFELSLWSRWSNRTKVLYMRPWPAEGYTEMTFSFFFSSQLIILFNMTTWLFWDNLLFMVCLPFTFQPCGCFLNSWHFILSKSATHTHLLLCMCVCMSACPVIEWAAKRCDRVEWQLLVLEILKKWSSDRESPCGTLCECVCLLGQTLCTCK